MTLVSDIVVNVLALLSSLVDKATDGGPIFMSYLFCTCSHEYKYNHDHHKNNTNILNDHSFDIIVLSMHHFKFFFGVVFGGEGGGGCISMTFCENFIFFFFCKNEQFI